MVVRFCVFAIAELVNVWLAMAIETPHQVRAALNAAAINQALNKYQESLVVSCLPFWVIRLAMPAKSRPQNASAIKVAQRDASKPQVS